MDLLSVAVVLAAVSGYGDVDDRGYPSWEERDVHLWTNAARVDPEAFESDYNNGGCSFEDFSSDEQTPKDPVFYSLPLNEAARFHSEDMEENSWFAHESSDGTSFGDRTARFYTDTSMVGENIAMGYGSGYNSVFVGWMCSTDGHRANIMSGSWSELGTGVAGSYYTQDFGAGTPDSEQNIRMGLHSPKSAAPGDLVTFLADYAGSPPTRFEVVVSGQAAPLELTWGTETSGVWSADVPLPAGAGCVEYYFGYLSDDGEGRFPQDGSYEIGSECESEFQWIERQMGVTGRDDRSDRELLEDVFLVGCTSTPRAGASLGLGLLALGLLWRRRA